ncbi:beta-ketoacyl synthase N-terminal-like domain-containing protein [Streptomyces yaanensis]|uniref:Beta-ketoacyl synthase N-terminal-like domain-containing protein n=1 Tax=Streptomyces yaanensis TaxID=1142239 RepID=A0ABV7S5T8_9ACTN|nr:beta-ketoacyl synthase N-terminal-like domain-containing protein [Streptomyces sp. CGMCC 4.7035]WNB99738.1 beta-ketoacyl synthase N-terminal-like domain-containing protein [Streptomyces sp. CGMCC 4.7035]
MNRSDVDARSVAVIGMACRLPGASGTDELWALLKDGVDATSETPPERYDVDALHSARGPGRIASRRAGYVEEIAEFDAEFFGMSATEALELDPQQRLLLMAAWEALEDAGQRPDLLAGSRTGVFVGNARADYLELALRQGPEGATASQLNNFRSLLPARISHAFDFRGPSIVVDTACSSSLVAVHQAVQSLRARESPLALAAGVNLKLRPDEGLVMTQAGGMAADGRSKFGDANADGHAPSDAVAVVVLKRLTDALADGDRIRAVIRGSAVGNDGRTSDSVLNPSLEGQIEVLRWAYEDAGIDPADVDYVEAHGSGSPALDPLELSALGRVLGEGRPADRPLLVGSVKTNIGHGEAAGGLAGLIKAVLCLEHGQVPASLHLSAPNPDVAWDELPLVVPGSLVDLPETGRPAVAGISGQGSSALNAHVVIRRPDPVDAPVVPAADGTPYLLVLSARGPAALEALARSYAAHLSPGGAGTAYPVRDICFSAATRRQHHAHRLAVVGASHEELAAALTGSPTLGGRPLSAVADRYRRGEDVDWEKVFGGGGRFVPLPTYPWQTKRYWPGEQHEHGGGDLATWVLREHARTGFDDASTLTDIGIDSLAKLRIVVELTKRSSQEVDPEEFGRLRTVGELRQWTRALEAAAR